MAKAALRSFHRGGRLGLQSCRECGEQVSTKAATCPHCGVSKPSKNKSTPSALLTGIVIVAVMAVMVAVFGRDDESQQTSQTATAAQPASTNDTSESPAPAKSSLVLAGQRGITLGVAMGCTDKQDLSTFNDAYGSAEVTHDQVGKQNAIVSALNASCQTIQSGQTGLVIDVSGFLVGYTRIRLDKDQVAYWLIREAVGPVK
jgi:hypothetical protein